MTSGNADVSAYCSDVSMTGSHRAQYLVQNANRFIQLRNSNERHCSELKYDNLPWDEDRYTQPQECRRATIVSVSREQARESMSIDHQCSLSVVNYGQQGSA